MPRGGGRKACPLLIPAHRADAWGLFGGARPAEVRETRPPAGVAIRPLHPM
jgi:hypothetical protein